jgi:hypothetical protein
MTFHRPQQSEGHEIVKNTEARLIPADAYPYFLFLTLGFLGIQETIELLFP